MELFLLKNPCELVTKLHIHVKRLEVDENIVLHFFVQTQAQRKIHCRMFNWNISDSYLDIRCEICTLAPVAAVNVAKTVMQV